METWWIAAGVEMLRRVMRRGRMSPRGCFGVYRVESRTWRTSGSAAGCNKPARHATEKAVKVVGNHEDGTGLVLWQRRAEAGHPGENRAARQEWTSRAQSDGEAIFGNPMRGAWCNTQARTTGKRLYTQVPSRWRRFGGPPGITVVLPKP